MLSVPARISPLNLSLNILGRFLGHKFWLESCEGTLGVMRNIWRHEWDHDETWNTGALEHDSQSGQQTWSVVSTNSYNPRDKHPMTLIMDEMGHLWQKQAHYSGPAGAVDINSDVGDVMKRVGETRWWQHEFSQQHFPSRVLGVIIIRQDSWGRYQQLWKHTDKTWTHAGTGSKLPRICTDSSS